MTRRSAAIALALVPGALGCGAAEAPPDAMLDHVLLALDAGEITLAEVVDYAQLCIGEADARRTEVMGTGVRRVPIAFGDGPASGEVTVMPPEADGLERYVLRVEREGWDGYRVIGEEPPVVFQVHFGYRADRVAYCSAVMQARLHHTQAVAARLQEAGSGRVGAVLSVNEEGARWQPVTLDVVPGEEGGLEWRTRIDEGREVEEALDLDALLHIRNLLEVLRS